MKFDIGGLKWKAVEEFQVWLKSGKNIGHDTCEDLSMFFTLPDTLNRTSPPQKKNKLCLPV